MGPRPDGRGTLTLAAIMKKESLLQWGRDRMAAERAAPPPPVRARRRFNGAATGWPRNVVVMVHQSFAHIGFNGAATGWPRNGNMPLSMAIAVLTGFNGAATGWPRNGGV